MRCARCGYLLVAAGSPGHYYAVEDDGRFSVAGGWCHPKAHQPSIAVAIREIVEMLA